MSDFVELLQSALSPGYTLERELPGGGMSRVFVATDVALARKVVVKVLPPELAAGVNHERFRREIQVAAQLQHPHVVPLLSAGEQQSLIWYTMPFINGESLQEALARGQAFSIKEIVRIMHEVAEALEYAHGLGVIHRDIKPGNVLMMRTHALVTDFGVAKAISASMPSSGFTSAGMAIGTPAYMAPEQIAADPAADHRVDLYALGLLAYELLTGTAPFKEGSPQKTMAAQLTRVPAAVESIRAEVPAALSALVRHLLEKIPEDRPQRAADVVEVLDRIADASGPILAPVRATRRASVTRTLVITGTGLAVVAAAWLLGERTGTTVGTSLMRDSLIAAESSQVMAAAAALLTREDSMAIAQAVSARMAARPASSGAGSGGTNRRADSIAMLAFTDSIRAQIQRAVLDSLVLLGARVLSATAPLSADARAGEAQVLAQSAQAPLNGVSPGARGFEQLRVIVAQPRSSRDRPEMDAIVRALADSLRRALDSHPRYAVVPPDSVAAVLAVTRTVNALQEQLRANLLISIALIPGADSVTRTVTVRRFAAGGAESGVRHLTDRVAANAPNARLDDVVRQVVRALFELEGGPRTRTSGGARQLPAQTSGPRPPRP